MAQVLARQSTYWDIVDSAGHHRISFLGKEEHFFSSAEFATWAILESHPVLIDYEQEWSSIYIASAPQDPSEVLSQFEACVARVLGGWRALAAYLNPQTEAFGILRIGHGMVAKAPYEVAAGFMEVLRQHDIGHTVLPAGKPRWPRRALVLGSSFVVAKDFAVRET